MLDEEMQQALNDQINAELASGYLYLSMATYFEDEDLPGFANSLRVHAEEELEHGMKIYDYIIRKNGSVKLQAIEEPRRQWDGLVDLSIKLSDHATNQFLQWFVEEQVEEEELAHEDLRKVKMAVDSKHLLFELDQQYGSLTNNDE